jgi:hypothetical protein
VSAAFPPEIVELLHRMEKGRDPAYFAEEILGVKLNPAQRRWFRLCGAMRDNGWQWMYRRVVHVAANQIGKTLGLAILILWAANSKMGVRTGNWDYWFSQPFKWYHLAPTHPQALYTYKDMLALIQGSHPAQFDRETGERRKIRWPEGFAKEVKFDGQYPGFKLWNGAEIHFRTSDEKAKAIQGVRAHGISFDEAAFEDWLHEVLDQAVKLRLVSTGGPLWLVSTPNGINDYYEVVMAVQQAGTQTFHERVWEAPAQRWALVWSYITDNVGYGLTQEDVDFMEEDVDPATKEQQLRGAFLEPVDAFFVPSQNILESWIPGLTGRQGPQNNHRYVIFWDPSVSSDPTVCIVLDVTRKPWKGVWMKRWEKPMSANTLLEEMLKVHQHWNTAPNRKGFPPRAITGFDATSMGGKILTQQLEAMAPKRPLNFGGGKVKLNALTNMRAALSRHDIWLPADWLRLQREVLSYRLDDKKLVQDCVMALAGALYIAAQGFSGAQRRPFVNSYRGG